jgi:hypothetical protein
MQEEIWKDVIGYEGWYQISSNGKLRSVDRIVTYPYGNSDRKFKGRELSGNTNNNGYVCYDLYKNSKRKKFLSHFLVMMSFVRPKEGKEDINHINGIKTDNRIQNLEYCSRSFNMKHAFKIGLCENTIAASKYNLCRKGKTNKKWKEK